MTPETRAAILATLNTSGLTPALREFKRIGPEDSEAVRRLCLLFLDKADELDMAPAYVASERAFAARAANLAPRQIAEGPRRIFAALKVASADAAEDDARRRGWDDEHLDDEALMGEAELEDALAPVLREWLQ